jgi:hypothetical protein
MSSRLLLGVTVLLALLVAGHSEPGEGSWPESDEDSWSEPDEDWWLETEEDSWLEPDEEFLGLPARVKLHPGLKRLHITKVCPNVECLLSILEKELSEGRIGAEEVILKRSADTPYEESATLGELIGFLQNNETPCEENFSPKVPSWYDLAKEGPLAKYMAKALDEKLPFCLSQLDTKIAYELKSVSESSRKQYEDFPFDLIDRAAVQRPNWALGALLRMFGGLENVQAVKRESMEGVVRACKEMTSRASLRNLPSYGQLGDLYTALSFPHIKFHYFCRALVDFNLEHELDSSLDYGNVKIFLQVVDEIRARGLNGGPVSGPMSTETAESGGEGKRLVAEAAVEYAKQWLSDRAEHSRSDSRYDLKIALQSKRQICANIIDTKSNLVWMHRHMHDVLCAIHGGQLGPDIERKFRLVELCGLVRTLTDDEIERITNAAVGTKEANAASVPASVPAIRQEKRPKKFLGFIRKRSAS